MKNDKKLNSTPEISLFDSQSEDPAKENTEDNISEHIGQIPTNFSDTEYFPSPSEPTAGEQIEVSETVFVTEDITDTAAQEQEEPAPITEDTHEDLPPSEDESEPTADEPKSEEPAKKDTDNGEKPRRIDSIFDFIELFVFTLAAVFIITSFFFRYSKVEGDSMQNTLQDDQMLLLSNFLYNPKPGDVVVVQDKSTDLKDPIVKRIIAVGGQRVKVTSTKIYVDGEPLDEDYVYTGDYINPVTGSRDYRYKVTPSSELLGILVGYQEGVYYEILVPDGEIFVMGDHRNNSKDSRDIGTLHEDAIIGKVVLRLYPFEEFGKIEE